MSNCDWGKYSSGDMPVLCDFTLAACDDPEGARLCGPPPIGWSKTQGCRTEEMGQQQAESPEILTQSYGKTYSH